MDLYKLFCHKIVGASDTAVGTHGKPCRKHLVIAVINDLIGKGTFALLECEKIVRGIFDTHEFIIPKEGAHFFHAHADTRKSGDMIHKHEKLGCYRKSWVKLHLPDEKRNRGYGLCRRHL